MRFRLLTAESLPAWLNCPSPPDRPRELRNASAHAARFTAFSAVRRLNCDCERVFAAPLSRAKLRFDCELSSVRPIDDRLPDRPLPDDKSPSDPLELGRKFRTDDELPSDDPRFIPLSERLNDWPLLLVIERPPLSPPLIVGPLCRENERPSDDSPPLNDRMRLLLPPPPPLLLRKALALPPPPPLRPPNDDRLGDENERLIDEPPPPPPLNDRLIDEPPRPPPLNDRPPPPPPPLNEERPPPPPPPPPLKEDRPPPPPPRPAPPPPPRPPRSANASPAANEIASVATKIDRTNPD